jgi:hypothetical protein
MDAGNQQKESRVKGMASAMPQNAEQDGGFSR